FAAFSPSGPRAAHVSEGVPRIASEQVAPSARQNEAADVTGATVTPAAGLDGEWSDPFAYCTAVGTIDFPDHRYSGDFVVASIADALKVPTTSSPDRLKWRCYEGEVLGCASYDRPVCALTPT